MAASTRRTAACHWRRAGRSRTGTAGQPGPTPAARPSPLLDGQTAGPSGTAGVRPAEAGAVSVIQARPAASRPTTTAGTISSPQAWSPKGRAPTAIGPDSGVRGTPPGPRGPGGAARAPTGVA